MRWASTTHALVATALVALLGCPASNDRPEVACADMCKVQMKGRCSDHDCERGCAFVLDRLVEREQQTVLECLKAAAPEPNHDLGASAEGPSGCGDTLWANCAAQVGPHADGGPGVPPPAEEP